MRSRCKAGILSIFAVLLLIGAATPAGAAETTSSEIVIVRPGDVLEDDLYAAAVRVIVEGEIDGDLVVFAAEDVVITGSVTGSVTAIAPTVRVDGTIGGSLRVAASQLSVGGEIRDDLVVAGLKAALEPGSRVGADILAWVSELRTAGMILGDLGGTQRTLRLGGSIQGEVDVSAGRVSIAEGTSVTGDLAYRSERDAVGLDGAEVGGSVVHRTPLPPNIRVRALGLFGRSMLVLFVALSALGISYLWPERTRAAADRLRASPVRNWLTGASILFSPAMLLAIAGVILILAPPATALPLMVVLVPMMLAVIGVALVAAVAATAPASVKIGGWISGKLDLFGAVLVGALVAGVIWLVPVVGWLVPILLLPWGLGGWLRSMGADAISETSA